MQINHKKIMLIMAERELTQAQLAVELDCHRTKISKVLSAAEEGKDFEPRTVGQLARALGVTPADIILETAPGASNDNT